MLFSPSCFINAKSLSQSRFLTQNVSFSVDVKPAVDDCKKLYHKHYKLTIHLKKKEEKKTKRKIRKMIFFEGASA